MVKCRASKNLRLQTHFGRSRREEPLTNSLRHPPRHPMSGFMFDVLSLHATRTTQYLLRLFCLLAFVFLLPLTGCMRHEPRADLVIVNGKEPESLDPAIITGQAEMRVASSMFEGLTRQDPKTGAPIPSLAESWEISPDGRIYTFHLRTNLVWSTGEPITADDVVYSWIRALDPATASDYAGQLYYLKNGEEFNSGKIKDPKLVGVHALDRNTVRAELNNPTAFWLDLCAFSTLSVVPRQTIEKYGDRWLMARPLPVSGAYELVAWRLNDKIRLKKNQRYWDAANTKIDVVDFLPITSATTALNLYETGGADIVWDKDLVPTELVDVLSSGRTFIRIPYWRRISCGSISTRNRLTMCGSGRRWGWRWTGNASPKRSRGQASNRPTALRRRGSRDTIASAGLGYDPEKARKLAGRSGVSGRERLSAI